MCAVQHVQYIYMVYSTCLDGWISDSGGWRREEERVVGRRVDQVWEVYIGKSQTDAKEEEEEEEACLPPDY